MRLLLALVFLGLALQVFGQNSTVSVANSTASAAVANSTVSAAVANSTVSAAVNASSISAAVNASSVSAAVAASSVSAAVAASSVSAAVAASSVSAAVAASSVSAAVAASSVSGAVVASSVSGAVVASSVSGAVAASSVVVAASSVVVGASASNTATATITPSGTYPIPPSPETPINGCPNFIINICPKWTDPLGFTYGLYNLYYTAQASGIVSVIRTSDLSVQITDLLPQTTYDVWVQGAIDGHWSGNSSIASFTTRAADPKKDPTRDIQGFSCVQTTNPKNNRKAALCSWTPALDTVRQINYKVRCVSSVREPTLVRRRVYGATAAAATSAFFAIHRDIATCTFKARFFYAFRATKRHSFTLTF